MCMKTFVPFMTASTSTQSNVGVAVIVFTVKRFFLPDIIEGTTVVEHPMFIIPILRPRGIHIMW